MPGIWSCPLFQNPQRMRVEKVGWLDCICHSLGLRWSDSFQVQSSTMSISQVIVWSIWPLALFVRDDSNPHEFTLSHSVYSFPPTRPFHVIIERRCCHSLLAFRSSLLSATSKQETQLYHEESTLWRGQWRPPESASLLQSNGLYPKWGVVMPKNCSFCVWTRRSNSFSLLGGGAIRSV